MTAPASTPAPATPTPTRSRAAVWCGTILGAVALPVIEWIIVDPVAGHHMTAEPNGQLMHVTVPTVVIGALAGALIGLGLMSILQRFTAKARGVFLTLSLIGLALSLANPLAGTDATTILVLMSMHLVVGAVVISGALLLPAKRVA